MERAHPAWRTIPQLRAPFGTCNGRCETGSDVLDERTGIWVAGIATDPPAYIGEPPSPPPDPSVFPREIAEVMRATLATLDLPRDAAGDDGSNDGVSSNGSSSAGSATV